VEGEETGASGGQGKALPSLASHPLKGQRPLRIPCLRPFYGLRGDVFCCNTCDHLCTKSRLAGDHRLPLRRNQTAPHSSHVILSIAKDPARQIPYQTKGRPSNTTVGAGYIPPSCSSLILRQKNHRGRPLVAPIHILKYRLAGGHTGLPLRREQAKSLAKLLEAVKRPQIWDS